MRRVLLLATVDQHIRHFHLPLIQTLTDNGYKVDVASNGTEEFEYIGNKYNIPFDRSPFTVNNFKSYFILKKILEKNKYDILHVNTPVASVIGRLACIKLKKKN